MEIKCVWLSPKRNFLKKVAFWAQAKYTSKTRFIYGPLRSINENALLGVLDYYRWYVHLRKCPSHRLTNSSVLSSPHLSSMSSFFVFFLFVFLCFFTGLPHNQQNPFQPLIFQTQNQQNQTKNNSKSTQKQLKINLNPENPSQTQLKINPKSIEKKKPKIPKSLCFNHLHLHLHHHHHQKRRRSRAVFWTEVLRGKKKKKKKKKQSCVLDQSVKRQKKEKKRKRAGNVLD